MRAVFGLLAVLAATATAAHASSQEPQQGADSLEQEVRLLKVRLDSLQQVLERLIGDRQDTVQVQDELAALRARAKIAAGRSETTSRASEEGEPSFVLRSTNLNRLNPEISVTGDVRFQATRPGPQENGVDIREFEFSFQSALDPYASTKIFVAFEGGEIDIEEGYVFWSGIPGGFRVDLGRIRQQIGELNRWHSHALPEAEYPLVIREYFGEEGLIGNGLSVYWIAPVSGPGEGTHELWAQPSLADNEVLFDGGTRLSILGHLNNFWQLNSSTYFQLGGTVVYGKNPDVDLKTSVFGADFRLTWRPPERAQYRSFTLRSEGYAVRKEYAGTGDTRYGGYVGAEYQLSRRLFAGARLDYVQPLDGLDDAAWAIVPRLKWWQSEWVYLSAEWQRHSLPATAGARETSDRFVIQAVWAIGPHKHEIF